MSSVARTTQVAGAAITVGAENANVRAITVQLKGGLGRNLARAAEVELLVLLNAAGNDFVATGGSTGLAIGAQGKLLTVVAKKLFRAISNGSGVITLTWTDTGTEAAYLGVKLPNGKLVVSAPLTNA